VCVFRISKHAAQKSIVCTESVLSYYFYKCICVDTADLNNVPKAVMKCMPQTYVRTYIFVFNIKARKCNRYVDYMYKCSYMSRPLGSFNVCCIHLKIKFRSCANGCQVGIFHYD